MSGQNGIRVLVQMGCGSRVEGVGCLRVWGTGLFASGAGERRFGFWRVGVPPIEDFRVVGRKAPGGL